MCKKCEIKPVYEFTNKRKVCKRCFINYFNKKFLFVVRKFELIKNNDVIAYEDKKDFKSVVLKELLEMISQKRQITIIKLPSRKKITKIVTNDTTDSQTYKIIYSIIKSRKNLREYAPKNKRVIKPLYLFLDKEVLLYAKLKKLGYKKTIEKKNKISLFIDGLEKKHPEIKRAVIKSFLEWNKS
jgi:tRNA(Ile)-lysidine synthase TilS/MesJ